jgi:two-component system response regulator PrrA
LAETTITERADDVARDPSIVADRVEFTLQFRRGRADRSFMEPTRRVLVIDDDEALRSAFSRVLTREGYTVHTAASAEDALAYVKEERPDAILLDLRMPLINGVGFLYRLRQDPANQNIAVALITGETTLDESTISDLRTLSAQVWHKPLSLDEIRRVTRALLNPGASPTL